MKSDQSFMGVRFFGGVILIYVISAYVQFSSFVSALHESFLLLVKILPAMGGVFILMILTNLFVDSKTVARYVGKTSGAQRWVVAITAGFISTGPIYLWYALLKDLMRKGTSKGVVASFLYARAIKPFLFPLMISYFGWSYTIVLTVVMIVASFVQGFLIEQFTE
ncbi:MAG: hypothetical protein WCX29_01040 [Candidatus Peribacteraceae bacterium]